MPPSLDGQTNFNTRIPLRRSPERVDTAQPSSRAAPSDGSQQQRSSTTRRAAANVPPPPLFENLPAELVGVRRAAPRDHRSPTDKNGGPSAAAHPSAWEQQLEEYLRARGSMDPARMRHNSSAKSPWDSMLQQAQMQDADGRDGTASTPPTSPHSSRRRAMTPGSDSRRRRGVAAGDASEDAIDWVTAAREREIQLRNIQRWQRPTAAFQQLSPPYSHWSSYDLKRSHPVPAPYSHGAAAVAGGPLSPRLGAPGASLHAICASSGPVDIPHAESPSAMRRRLSPPRSPSPSSVPFRSKGERFVPRSGRLLNPGPGHYIGPTESSAWFTGPKIGIHGPVRRVDNNNVPGPGSYEIPSSFQPPPYGPPRLGKQRGGILTRR